MKPHSGVSAALRPNASLTRRRPLISLRATPPDLHPSSEVGWVTFDELAEIWETPVARARCSAAHLAEEGAIERKDFWVHTDNGIRVIPTFRSAS